MSASPELADSNSSITLSEAGGQSNTSAGDVSFGPGVVVLAKLKGFPAWPGIIVEESTVNPSVLDAKPKGSSNQRWPVRFFNDVNYMWASKAELQVLTKDQASNYGKSGKAKKDKALLGAYQIAADPPTLEDLIATDKEAADKLAAAATEKASSTKKSRKSTTTAPVESESNGTAKEKKPPTPKTKSVPKKKVTTTTTASAITSDESPSSKKRKSTSIEGEGAKESKKSKPDNDTTSNNHIKPKAKKPVATSAATNSFSSPAPSNKIKHHSPISAPSAKELAKSTEMRSKLCLLIRHKLQKGFLGKEPLQSEDMSALSEYLHKLESLTNLELSIIRQTKVNKVLKAIVGLSPSAIPLESEYNFRDRSLKLLNEWNSMAESIPKEYDGSSNGKKENDDGEKDDKDVKPEKEKKEEKPPVSVEKKETPVNVEGKEEKEENSDTAEKSKTGETGLNETKNKDNTDDAKESEIVKKPSSIESVEKEQNSTTEISESNAQA